MMRFHWSRHYLGELKVHNVWKIRYQLLHQCQIRKSQFSPSVYQLGAKIPPLRPVLKDICISIALMCQKLVTLRMQLRMCNLWRRAPYERQHEKQAISTWAVTKTICCVAVDLEEQSLRRVRGR